MSSLSTPRTFIVRGVPRPQGSKKIVNRNHVPRMVEANPHLAGWRENVAMRTREALGKGYGTEARVYVHAWFAFRRPASHLLKSGALKAGAPSRPGREVGDVDKLVRALLDGMATGGAFGDDGQVVELRAEKRYNSPAERPMALVHVGVVR